MGNHEHQALPGRPGQQLDDFGAVFAVQVSGGFVRNEDGGWLGQGTGNGQALLLSAGQLGRPTVLQLPQLHFPENRLRLNCRLRLVHSGDTQGADHILQHRAAGQNVITLGNKADAMAAVVLPVRPIIVGGGAAVDHHFTALIGQNTGDHLGQGGLAAAALAGDGHKLSGTEGQVDAIQTHDHRLPGGVVLGYVTEFQQFLPHERHPLSKAIWKNHTIK